MTDFQRDEKLEAQIRHWSGRVEIEEGRPDPMIAYLLAALDAARAAADQLRAQAKVAAALLESQAAFIENLRQCPSAGQLWRRMAGGDHELHGIQDGLRACATELRRA